jgi:prepilin-type N-terminal cleavage/methylation domain-containing protein
MSIKRSRAAMTLVEMMVGMAIASLVLTGIGMLVVYGNRSFAAMANYVSLDQRSRHTLDLMTKEIRQTNRLVEHSSTHLVFEDFDGAPLVYLYLSSNRTLVRMKNSVLDPKPLLTGCDFLSFSIFQRNVAGGSYDQYPAASPDTCKLVQMSWVCSRPLIGSLVNTESVQSAKVVIRKQ